MPHLPRLPDPPDPFGARTWVRGAPAWTLGMPLSPDRLAALAAEQRGLLTHAQLRAAGWTWKSMDARVRAGSWTRPFPMVYLTQPGRDDPLTTMIAALLAVGDPAALSHESAAYLHGLRREAPEQVDLIVPEARRARPPGVLLHRTRRFDGRVDVSAWPWRTTVEETILDLADAAATPVERVIELAARACAQRSTTPGAIGRALAARSRHRLRAELTDVVREVRDGAQSVMEVRFVRDVLRAHGLPSGVGQHASAAGVHDRAFPGQRVLVELDGRLGHAGWQGRRRDSRRDRLAAGDGWLTTRGYWTDVVGVPCRFAVELGALLAARGWPGDVRPCRRPGCSARRAVLS